MTNQDIIFSTIENIIKAYYSKRFPNKKTFDTVLLVDRIVKTKNSRSWSDNGHGWKI